MLQLTQVFAVIGGAGMQTTLVVLLIIDAIALIALVLLQSGKSAGLSGAISGGAEQLFGKQKARGLDLFLHRGTIVTGVILFILTFLLAYVLQ
jgi:preprotein translocase subunit SecG